MLKNNYYPDCLTTVFVSLSSLSSLSCSSVRWHWCVWAWTSSSSSSTRSGCAADGEKVTRPRTPIHTPTSLVQTAAAPLGVSSSPHSSAGERSREIDTLNVDSCLNVFSHRILCSDLMWFSFSFTHLHGSLTRTGDADFWVVQARRRS